MLGKSEIYTSQNKKCFDLNVKSLFQFNNVNYSLVNFTEWGYTHHRARFQVKHPPLQQRRKYEMPLFRRAITSSETDVEIL